MSSLQEQYQAERRQVSASGIYRPPAPASAAPSRYTENAYQGLQQYQSASADKLDQRPSESYTAYGRRLTAIGRALPQGEVEARLASARKTASEQSWSWEAQRADFDGRQTGSGRGVMGRSDTPQQRAAALGSRFGGRQVRAQGDLAARALTLPGQPVMASMAEINQIIQAREAARTGQQPQHADVSQLRSTGNDFLGVNR